MLERAEQRAGELWQDIRSAYDRLSTPAALPFASDERAIAVAGDITAAQLRAIMPAAGARTARFVGPLDHARARH